MSSLETELEYRLAELDKAHLLRHLRVIGSPQATEVEINGKALLNFSSNDYLGLASHPMLKEEAEKAIRQWGTGSGASRLICGSLKLHHELEETLAAFKGAEAAIVFSSGYATALGVITALIGKSDFAIIDKLVHASIVDAARLSGATLRIFDHNDLADLEKTLQWVDRKKQSEIGARQQTLIITETVFSMDGDIAPLKQIVELKEKYGAWLMVDEAHATGLLGKNRSGLVEAEGLTGRVEVQMGTLGKAVGSAGGYVAGSRRLIDYLINKARSFIFSTAPVPAQSAAALAGIRLIQSAEGAALVQVCFARVEQFRRDLAGTGLQTSGQTPIQPIIIGDEQKALWVGASLREKGFLAPAIRYPTVARGAARLRVTFSATHTENQVRQLTHALVEAIA
ncbi:MAG: 8-amino-7-oxononanoate synthase [Verrucomicrobiales bacterium]